MQKNALTSPRVKTLLGTLSTMLTIAILAAFSTIALVSSDEAQRVFVTFVLIAGVSFVTRTRKYPTAERQAR